MTTLPKMLKTMSLKIIHHLICQCENLNNTYERLSLLMYILHQEGSFSIAHFYGLVHCVFWNSHIQLIAFLFYSAQILLPSYTCSFLRLLICKSVRIAATNVSNLQKHHQLVLLFNSSLKNSQQSAHKVILNNKNAIVYNFFAQRA